jgi:hypothetical protein
MESKNPKLEVSNMNHSEVKNRIPVVLAAILFVTAIAALLALDPQRALLSQVQKGEVELVCDFANGSRVVAPEKVTGLIEETWIFTNGSARSCRVAQKNTEN